MTKQALIATRKGLFQLDDKQQLAEVAFIGDPVSMLLASPCGNILYAALDLGHFGVKLHRSTDAGNSWNEISTPSYPEVKDKEKGDALTLIWSLVFAEPGNTEKLWAGTIPGGLFYSADGGQSWLLNESLWKHKNEHEWFGGGFDQPGIHSICVDPRNSNEIKVGISCGGVWVTKDNGQSWQNQAHGMRAAYMPPEQAMDPNIQDPHLIVQCQSQPDIFWCQHHNGIFKSIDNCKSWQEITDVKPSNFGFAVAVDPNDGNKAWFVPGVKDECRVPVDARFLVNHTQDGGDSFEPLFDGLPENNCYDLVLRHALAIDKKGERLLMGSSTGNLWLSNNLGISWQNLSHHLPPIYALVFID